MSVRNGDKKNIHKQISYWGETCVVIKGVCGDDFEK